MNKLHNKSHFCTGAKLKDRSALQSILCFFLELLHEGITKKIPESLVLLFVPEELAWLFLLKEVQTFKHSQRQNDKTSNI